MSYFARNYSALTFPLEVEGRPGFRDAQRGALFAIGSHFTRRSDPAIITMPTGSGKTAVLQGSGFLLRASRVLVITPSRLVREQIADDFKNVGVLKRLRALPFDIGNPAVMATSGKVRDAKDWDQMRKFDVVVATVQSVSPHLKDVPAPPPDLFDLVLVDEAHHSPAATWSMLLDVFPAAKKVLFTATPFRRDDKEIKGKFIYTYDLRTAYEDGVFGHIDYVPVEVADENDVTAADVAVAKAAEAKLNLDREGGQSHLLMVRTDSKARASELEKIYSENTQLKLRVVHGSHSLRYSRQAISDLENDQLDGIICVNMLGEGFDMPRLKVAAVHAPHRSLAVTLQFIGRFARTSGKNLGAATFLATRKDIKLEAEKLYSAGAVWSEIVPNLSQTRLEREVHTRETLDSFALQDLTVPALSDLSLYTLFPYAHVKVFRLREPFDIRTTPVFGSDRDQVYGSVSEATNSAIYITRKAGTVAWSLDDRLMDIRFDIFIFYYNPETNLLFVCASKRVDGLYQRKVRDMVGYDARLLGLSALNKALNELEGAKFYNVGMRNRHHSSLTESYRMITGSRADEAIRPEDARLFHRGHCFGSAKDKGVDITIGLSRLLKKSALDAI
ncbi:Superfamily II DNA or RNA helicase [Roseomonas rosea]|uniref:Superfamily II DNA or RNA helicase n=1 Tax=Muricoccus roseus TaxID=198092 RepID=A0A1M6S2P2_9PROT|nr:Superfamily II DNA or RNA helicase [Roseomonas rosea]